MILSCQNCYQNFQLDSNSLSYLNPDFSLAGICTSCYHEIDSKLKLLVDVGKLKLIKKKSFKNKRINELNLLYKIIIMEITQILKKKVPRFTIKKLVFVIILTQLANFSHKIDNTYKQSSQKLKNMFFIER